MGGPESLLSASEALSPFNVPVLKVRPDLYSEVVVSENSNILTTAPDLGGQARSLAHLGSSLGARRGALITSSQHTVTTFLTEATSLGIRVQEMLELHPRQPNIGLAVETFIRSIARPRPVVAVVLEAEDVEKVAEHLNSVDLPSSPVWLVGSLGLELRSIKSWRKVFSGGALVEPHLPELREFKHYFLQSVKSPVSLLSNTVEEYMAELTGCKPLGSCPCSGVSVQCCNVPTFSGVQSSNGKGVSCSNISLEEMELRFQQDPQVCVTLQAQSWIIVTTINITLVE